MLVVVVRLGVPAAGVEKRDAGVAVPEHGLRLDHEFGLTRVDTSREGHTASAAEELRGLVCGEPGLHRPVDDIAIVGVTRGAPAWSRLAEGGEARREWE